MIMKPSGASVCSAAVTPVQTVQTCGDNPVQTAFLRAPAPLTRCIDAHADL